MCTIQFKYYGTYNTKIQPSDIFWLLSISCYSMSQMSKGQTLTPVEFYRNYISYVAHICNIVNCMKIIKRVKCLDTTTSGIVMLPANEWCLYFKEFTLLFS